MTQTLFNQVRVSESYESKLHKINQIDFEILFEPQFIFDVHKH